MYNIPNNGTQDALRNVFGILPPKLSCPSLLKVEGFFNFSSTVLEFTSPAFRPTEGSRHSCLPGFKIASLFIFWRKLAWLVGLHNFKTQLCSLKRCTGVGSKLHFLDYPFHNFPWTWSLNFSTSFRSEKKVREEQKRFALKPPLALTVYLVALT